MSKETTVVTKERALRRESYPGLSDWALCSHRSAYGREAGIQSQTSENGNDAIPAGDQDPTASRETAAPARRSAALLTAFSDFWPPEMPNGICYSSDRKLTQVLYEK